MWLNLEHKKILWIFCAENFLNKFSCIQKTSAFDKPTPLGVGGTLFF
jgi:hypothetical protein